MSFYTQLPTYQVETQKGSTLYSSQAQAIKAYQKFVKENVPCEFYEEGFKKKEFKP